MPSSRADAAFITTPIYYVNDRPHIGHAYTTIISDVWARASRLQGRSTFFLTGTDEHGAKVEKSATARGITPQALADENAAEFQRVLGTFGITCDDFIRTTQPRHIRQVQAFLKALAARGAVTLGTFQGWYDEGQEEYYTETRAKDLGYKSPISGRDLVRASEDNYYFRLSQFQKPLEAFFAANPGFVQPQGRFNEVLGRLRDGLQDVPITRTNFAWGIPFPGDGRHVVYVWIDALLNYVTAMGVGAELANSLGIAESTAPEGSTAGGTGHESDDATLAALAAARSTYWPAQYHVIGKEILWFHAVIWPAMLMALELPLPRRIHAHSFWIADGQKMSKSMGNFIDLPTIDRYIGTYGLDAWRWYMATQGPLQAADADFRAAHFHEMYTAELVNLVGNCASRVGAMVGKYCGGTMPMDSRVGRSVDAGAGAAGVAGMPAPRDAIQCWVVRCGAAVATWREAMEDFDLVLAARAALDLLRDVDAYINRTEPFKLAKDPSNAENMSKVHSILAQCTQTVRVAGVLLLPFLPEKMDQLAQAFGGVPAGCAACGSVSIARVTEAGCSAGDFAALARYGEIPVGAAIAKTALFPRIERKES
ncbi:MAG: methionine--tRNA ligase [Planctomycetota bacterium]|nr:methionine--tRNA ligase [Planctomycetota bacterium]MDA1105882.1 methionine--tRNA ligase [Planctomycetota bacterium]